LAVVRAGGVKINQIRQVGWTAMIEDLMHYRCHADLTYLFI